MKKSVYGVAVFCTAVIAHLVWKYASHKNFPDSIIGKMLEIVFPPLLVALSSYASFIIILNIFLFTINKFTFIKKIFYNTEYVEGWWVGFYQRANDNPNDLRFIVEDIEQTFDEITVKGVSYTETGNRISTWDTTHHPVLLKKNKLSFIHEDTLVNDNKIKSEGYNCYELSVRVKNFLRIPDTIDGTISHHAKPLSRKARIFYAERITKPSKKKIKNLEEDLLTEAKVVWETKRKFFRIEEDCVASKVQNAYENEEKENVSR